MVKKQMSLEDLKLAIAKEEKEAKDFSEIAIARRRLRELQDAKSNKALKRIGRGLRILVKKGTTATGKGIRRARKFAEESGAAKGLDFGTSKARAVPRRVRIIKRRPRKVSTIIRRTTIRRVKLKPRRRVVRRRPANDGFFDFNL